MNREIKFRAWDTRLKMWCYGLKDDGFTLFGEVLMIDGFTSHFHENPAKDETGKEMLMLDRLNDIEFMQFTGLKDKNGKEIYEGDVIRVDGKWNGKVFFYQSHCRWEIEGGTFYIHLATESLVEVIGNIYEHHDLLKP